MTLSTINVISYNCHELLLQSRVPNTPRLFASQLVLMTLRTCWKSPEVSFLQGLITIICKNPLYLHFLGLSRVLVISSPSCPLATSWDPSQSIQGSMNQCFREGRGQGSSFFSFQEGIFGSSINLPTSPTLGTAHTKQRWYGSMFMGAIQYLSSSPWGSAACLTYIRVSRDSSMNSHASTWLIVSICSHTSGWWHS